MERVSVCLSSRMSVATQPEVHLLVSTGQYRISLCLYSAFSHVDVSDLKSALFAFTVIAKYSLIFGL